MHNFALHIIIQSDSIPVYVLSRIKFELKMHGFTYLLSCKSTFSAWKKKGLMCNTESFKYSLGFFKQPLFI